MKEPRGTGAWLAMIGLAVAAAGCGSDAPLVAILAEPAEDIAPATIFFNTASTSEKENAVMRVRFDFDGDGNFDTEFGEEQSASFLFETPGSFVATVEVTDQDDARGTASANILIRENVAPVASLAVTPDSGRLPLASTFDASGSSDIDQDDATLEVRFDFDGDGIFDTEFQTEKTVEHVFGNAGTLEGIVEVKDNRGAISTARFSPIMIEPGVDLDVDTNRDGLINDLDDQNEAQWSDKFGAVFLANLDDDDVNGTQDGRQSALAGPEDERDLSELFVRRYPGLDPGATVTVSVSDDARAEVRLFIQDSPGVVRELLGPGGSSATIDAARLDAGDVRLLIEAVRGRTTAWDGFVTIKLSIDANGATADDEVRMRCAPVLFPDNTQTSQVVYIMRISDNRLIQNLPFHDTVARTLPPSVQMYSVDQYQYLGDRWLQDNMQTAYQRLPGEGGNDHIMQSYLQTVRPTGAEGLEYFVTRELLGPDQGYYFTGGGDTSHNYGGNLEITPPLTAGGVEYPFGRIMIGGGSEGSLLGRGRTDRMTSAQRQYMDAQEAQGPSLELSSEWLAVGHIDEIFMFIPDPSQTNGKNWKVIFASPDLARQILEGVEADGFGNVPVFAGRETQTSATRILGDDALMAYNDAAQARIDSIREVMEQELGITDEDVIEVPVLYENVVFGGSDFAVALNPGIQNLVPVDDTLYTPDPEGPVISGVDPWAQATLDRIEPLGLNVEFVDVFESYHLNFGEAHCGTSVQRAPHATRWWEVGK